MTIACMNCPEREREMTAASLGNKSCLNEEEWNLCPKSNLCVSRDRLPWLMFTCFATSFCDFFYDFFYDFFPFCPLLWSQEKKELVTYRPFFIHEGLLQEREDLTDKILLDAKNTDTWGMKGMCSSDRMLPESGVSQGVSGVPRVSQEMTSEFLLHPQTSRSCDSSCLVSPSPVFAIIIIIINFNMTCWREFPSRSSNLLFADNKTRLRLHPPVCLLDNWTCINSSSKYTLQNRIS